MAVDKLVDSTQLDADLTTVANAIRTKGGTSADLAFPAGFVSAVQAIPSGGGGVSVDDIATNTEPSGAISVSVQTIATHAFDSKPITSVSGANVTDIKNAAFEYCTSLKNVNFPELVSMTGTYVFQGCSDLEVAHFPKLTTTAANGYVFYKLKSSISGAKAVIVMPKAANLGSRAFDRVYADKIDIGPDLASLPSDMFYNNVDATVVNTLILRRTADVVTSSNTDRIKGLKDVYVPSALVSTYEGASNWSTRVAAGKITFHAIEGSIYETKYADGTPIT